MRAGKIGRWVGRTVAVVVVSVGTLVATGSIASADTVWESLPTSSASTVPLVSPNDTVWE
jgi:hypothetical protein